MSRSYRKPVYKAKSPKELKRYNRIYKTRCRQITRSMVNMNDEELDKVKYPVINEVYEFWSFCDYVLNFIGMKLGKWHEDWGRRITRK